MRTGRPATAAWPAGVGGDGGVCLGVYAGRGQCEYSVLGLVSRGRELTGRPWLLTSTHSRAEAHPPTHPQRSKAGLCSTPTSRAPDVHYKQQTQPGLPTHQQCRLHGLPVGSSKVPVATLPVPVPVLVPAMRLQLGGRVLEAALPRLHGPGRRV